MNFKRMLSAVITVCMIFSLISVTTFAAGEANLVRLETYVDVRVDNDSDGIYDKNESDEYVTESQIVDYAFKGEVLKTVLSIENSTFVNYDVIISYNNAVVQLVNAEGDVLDSETKSVAFGVANGTKDVNTLGLKKVQGAISPYHGLIAYSAKYSSKDGVTAAEKSDLVEMNFKVIADGDPKIGFALKENYTNSEIVTILRDTDQIINPSANVTGCKFVFKGDSLNLSYNNAIASIYEKPADIAQPVWNEFVGEWDIPADTNCRGYIVELFKGDDSIYYNDGVAVNSMDFLPIIRENGKATYKFSITPVGKDENATTVTSEIFDVQGINLLPPSDLVYDPETGFVSWKGNDPEAAGYTVEIYEGEVTEDSVPVKTYTGITSTSKDIADDITVGDYTIVVKATSNDNLFIDSDYSDPVKYSTGSYIYGDISYITQKTKDSVLVVSEYADNPLQVTLTDANNSGNVVEPVTVKDGKFAFTGVPNGKYTVTISRDGIVDRTLSDIDLNPVVLELTSSESKQISKGEKGIQVYLGDVDTDDTVGPVDLGIMIELQGCLEGDVGYSNVSNFFGNDDVIEGLELNLVIANYNSTIFNYALLDDYILE